MNHCLITNIQKFQAKGGKLIYDSDGTWDGDSIVSIVTCSGLVFESWQEQEIFFYLKPSRLALRSTQPPTNQPGCDDDHSPPSVAEIRSEQSHISLPPISFMVWMETTLPLPLPLQNMSCINGDKLNNIRNKCREYFKDKIVCKGVTDPKKD